MLKNGELQEKKKKERVYMNNAIQIHILDSLNYLYL